MQKQISTTLFLITLLTLIFLPRVLSPSSHWSSDESQWMARSRTFILALESGNFADTLTTHHPGVTTTWIGGATIWVASGRRSVSEWLKSIDFFSTTMLARIRFPIALLTGLLILLAGELLYRLFGTLYAAIGTLFLAIEPSLLAESRRIHTDVLTAEFLLLTLLLWLCYLEAKTPRRRDLVFSGICFGLACLTKSHAGAFLMFLPLILFWYTKQRGLSGAKMLISLFLFSSVTLMTVLITLPYLWTLTFRNLPIAPFILFGCSGVLLWSWKKLSTQASLSRTELSILGGGLLLIAVIAAAAAKYILAGMYTALTTAHELPTLFLGDIRYNPGPLYYPVMLFVWSTLLAVPLTSLAIYGAWQQRHQNPKLFRITIVLICFSLFYVIGLSFVAKKIARYLVIFLPAMSILAAIGVIHLTQYFSKTRIRYLALAVVIILQIVPVLRLHPYYITYHFPLLSGEWISKNTSLGGGVGLDIAATYLNNKPDAQNLKVRASPFATGLDKYFVGETLNQHTTAVFDYDVEYIRVRQIQGVPIDALPTGGAPATALQLRNTSPRELEHIVQLNGVDYVWIYRVLNPHKHTAPTNKQ